MKLCALGFLAKLLFNGISKKEKQREITGKGVIGLNYINGNLCVGMCVYDLMLMLDRSGPRYLWFNRL